MTYYLLSICLGFVLIGFIFTKKNAAHILPVYNEMSKEQQNKFNLKSYINYFRGFHIVLGISFFLIGKYGSHYADSATCGIVTASLPILAYVFLMVTSARYFNLRKQ